MGLRQNAISEKAKKMQFVQYESEKSKLKEEYEKRVGFLHKRMSKRATMDPSLLLLTNMTTVQKPMSTRNSIGRPSSSDPFFQGLDIMDQFVQGGDRATQHGKQMMLQKKILSGPKSTRFSRQKSGYSGPNSVNDFRRRNADYDYGMRHPLNNEDDKKNPQQKKAEYYKFYLDNAQKAIDMMIEQHKSQASLSQ